MSDKLNTKAYWESYCKHNHAKKVHIEAVCGYYKESWEVFIDSSNRFKSLIGIDGLPKRTQLAIQKLIYKGHSIIFKYFGNTLLLKKPSRFFSSSIIAIFERS